MGANLASILGVLIDRELCLAALEHRLKILNRMVCGGIWGT